MTAPYMSYDTHRRLYRFQRPVPLVLQEFFRSKVQRKWLGGDKVTAAERARYLASYHDGVFRRLARASPADQDVIRMHKWEGLSSTRFDDYEVFSSEFEDPREAARRYVGRGVTEHEGVPLVTAAGQALLQDHLRRHDDKVHDLAAVVAKIAPTTIAEREGLDALHPLWIESFGSNPPKRTSDYRASLELFIGFMDKPSRWIDIRSEDAKRWRDAMEQESLLPRRVKNHLKALSAMWAGAMSKTYGAEAESKVNPFHKVSPTGWKKVAKQEQRDTGKTFRPEWTQALLARAIADTWGSKRHTLVMDCWMVCRRTGARPQEITGLQRGDLILGPDGLPALRITGMDAGSGYKTRHLQKGDKTVESDRTIPLHSALHAWWKRARAGKPCDLIFDTLPYHAEKGRSMWFSQNFHRLRAKCADVPDALSFYNFRHTYITAIAGAAAAQGFKDTDHEYVTAHGVVTVHKKYQDPSEFAKLRQLVEAVSVP